MKSSTVPGPPETVKFPGEVKICNLYPGLVEISSTFPPVVERGPPPCFFLPNPKPPLPPEVKRDKIGAISEETSTNYTEYFIICCCTCRTNCIDSTK
jgi:hypothetical protein